MLCLEAAVFAAPAPSASVAARNSRVARSWNARISCCVLMSSMICLRMLCCCMGADAEGPGNPVGEEFVIAERQDGCPRAAEIKMRIMVPGEADTAVELDRLRRDRARRLVRQQLDRRHEGARLGRAGRTGAGILRERAGTDEFGEKIRRAMLQRLKLGELLAELLAQFQIFDRHLKPGLRRAQHF